MRSFRFVHAADLHLDTPFVGIAHVAPHVATALRDASLDAWDDLVALTIDEGAACLLLAGDIYDGEERGVRAQLRFRDGLERLSECGIATCIVHGNHDPLGGWSAIRSWPEGVTVFGADEVGTETIGDPAAPLATVHGISYARREVTENLALRFRRSAASGLQIGLLHCNVGAHAEHAAYSPCTLDDLWNAGLDYWALGHVHVRQTWTSGSSWAVYPGNLQGRHVKASERAPKGAVVATVEDDRVVDVAFRALDRVRFHVGDVDISRCQDVYQVKAALLDLVPAMRAEHGARGILATVRLTGRTPLHADLQRPETLPELIDELREAFADDAPFLWWDALQLRTRAPRSLRAVRGRDDFLGAVVRYGDTLVGSPATLESFVDRHASLLRSLRLPPELAQRELAGDAWDEDELRDADDAGEESLDADEPAGPPAPATDPVQPSLFDAPAGAAPLVPTPEPEATAPPVDLPEPKPVPATPITQTIRRATDLALDALAGDAP